MVGELINYKLNTVKNKKAMYFPTGYTNKKAIKNIKHYDLMQVP